MLYALLAYYVIKKIFDDNNPPPPGFGLTPMPKPDRMKTKPVDEDQDWKSTLNDPCPLTYKRASNSEIHFLEDSDQLEQ